MKLSIRANDMNDCAALRTYLAERDARAFGRTVRHLAHLALADVHYKSHVGTLLLDVKCVASAKEPRIRVTVLPGTKLNQAIHAVVSDTGRGGSEVLLALMILGWRTFANSKQAVAPEPIESTASPRTTDPPEVMLPTTVAADDDRQVNYNNLQLRSLIKGL